MGRNRKFNENEALEAAMLVFWSKGYEASSVQELLDAMGINRASLYSSFGDKRALFAAALKRYAENVNRCNLGLLEGEASAAVALGRYFDALLGLSSSDPVRLGCMLANTAVELAPHDKEIDRTVTGIFERAERAFETIIRRGQDSGEFSAHRDPQALARVLMTAILGLRVRSRCSICKSELRQLAEATLQVLELSGSESPIARP
jgi:TetR/AcrR family transcriptional repressor of nem operon